MQGQWGRRSFLISWRNRVETDVKREMWAQNHPHPRIERIEHRTTQQEGNTDTVASIVLFVKDHRVRITFYSRLSQGEMLTEGKRQGQVSAEVYPISWLQGWEGTGDVTEAIPAIHLCPRLDGRAQSLNVHI